MTSIDALLRRWAVVPDGRVIRTPSSQLVFGQRGGRAVVLKVAHVEEEQRGARLLAWWDGRGAIRVLELDGDAVLLERATGTRDLTALAAVDDPAATTVLCRAVLRLHASGNAPDHVGLMPLTEWFTDLVGTPRADPLLRRCAQVARRVLAATEDADVVALHGDVHHGNVLDTGAEWAVIDPKGLVGHRAFDYANVFCNPDERLAVTHLHARLPLVARLAGLDEPVLRDWIIAWCGLSLVWQEGESESHPGAARAVAQRLLPC